MTALSLDASPRILQLPLSVINKIAAGEVIERPASVVKELLENSLDAGATRIDVDVEAGGTELIRVVDNGKGIQAADFELAFANHATSKLATADDLFSIQSMGFRGEALSSIGGIAHVTLQSRPPEEMSGAEIHCRGGDLSPVRDWNGSPGTRIEVRHLFFNTPVRRKFMKSASTEMGHIAEVATRIALAHPGLHLTLRHNGKLVYEIPGSAGLLERIGLFFGDEVRGQLYNIDQHQGPNHLFGFIADPACDRGTSKLQYLFLNGRWIRDRSLGHAIQEGFRGLLMTGRYAVAFLFLEIPPGTVDVNVHPTKCEVRFAESQKLYHLVLSTLRNRLAAQNLTARLKAPAPAPNGYFQPRAEADHPSLFSQPGFPSFIKRPMPEPPARPAEPALPPPPQNSPLAPPIPEIEPKAIQLHNAYLVLETAEGMLVIDQHALHERILFEHVKERFRQGTLEAQKLLIPEPVELSAEQAARTLEHQGALAALGLGVEGFGGSTILITSYPALLSRTPPADILKAILDHINSYERTPAREALLEECMSLMACHAAVRSGDPLGPEEIADLVRMRHLASDAHHCPHGRPTALLFTRHELDKQFKRI